MILKLNCAIFINKDIKISQHPVDNYNGLMTLKIPALMRLALRNSSKGCLNIFE